MTSIDVSSLFSNRPIKKAQVILTELFMNDISPHNHTMRDATQVILSVGLCEKATIFGFP